MIRLVASDMDGTLLDENSQVPPETFGLIRQLDKAGVRFVVSSGRRLDTLREFLAPVADRIDFVASNGAQVMVAGELVDREVFSHMALGRLKKVVDTFDCLHMALFDEKNSYLLDEPEHFELEADKDLRQAVVVSEVRCIVFSDTAPAGKMEAPLQRRDPRWPTATCRAGPTPNSTGRTRRASCRRAARR